MHMTIGTKKVAVPLVAVAAFVAGAGLMVSASAFAATNPSAPAQPDQHGVSGTVTAVSGNTITLTGKNGTMYTIDAASTTVDKVSSITVSQIVAGDTLMVRGSVSGATVTAAHIMDGVMPMKGHGRDGDHGRFDRPHVVGTIQAVNGSSLTVLGKNGTTYTVDATSAKVMKFVQGAKPAQSTLSSVAVGDLVGIRGTVSGTTVTATSVMDGIPSLGMHRGAEGKN